jgi:LmbE family N-acetylglucosaminyl deacetylase
MKILALGAHPDDLEIYMWGALAAWQARGDILTLATATDGSRGGKGDPAALKQTRATEAMAAALLLKAMPNFLGFEDGTLVANVALIGKLKALMAATEPDLIVTHAPNDYHGDHRALSDAVRIAANFQAPVLWADTMQGVGFVPTHYVDITPHIDQKANAIRAHASQDPDRFVNMSRQLNSFRAAQANAKLGSYAEAYRFEPVFPFVDIREMLPPAPAVRPIGGRRRPAD